MRIDDHFLLGKVGERPIEFIPTTKMSGVISPEFIVNHYTVAGKASSIYALSESSRQVSAHLLICADGEIKQFVPFNRRAWHAGRSTWEGRAGCNGFTIGIEYENIGPLKMGKGQYLDVYGRDYSGGLIQETQGSYHFWAAYTADQLEAGQQATEAILAAYADIRGILGHSDISPGRKIDPGPAFPMEHFAAMVDDRGDRDSDEPSLFSTTTRLNMRTTPGGTWIQTLPKGEKVIPKGETNGFWWKVKIANLPDNQNQEGWVYSKYLVPRSK